MGIKKFKTSNGATVLVMNTEEFVEFYLRVNGSNWFFCVAYRENFNSIDRDNAESIAEEYYDTVVEKETYIEAVF